MTDVEKLLKRYSLSKKVVKKWAAKKFPKYKDNLRMMISMYLQETEGLKLDPFELGMVTAKEHVPVSDLEYNVFSQIVVLVASKISEFEYNACSECNKKVGDDNECETHGEVSTNLVAWKKYIAGDETGDLIFTLPPTTTYGGEMVNLEFRAEGSLREDRGEFLVRHLTPITDEDEEESESEVEEEEDEAEDVESDEKELEAVTQFVDIYGGAPIGTLKAWHKSKKMKTPVKILIKAAKLKLKDGKYYVV